MSTLYIDAVELVHERSTGQDVGVPVAAVIDDCGPTIRVGDLDFTPGQARLLLAKVHSAVAHLDYLMQAAS